MDAKVFLACLAVSIFVSERGLAMPSTGKVVEVSNDPSTEDRRATWLDTRTLKQNFKAMVYLSIQELVSEGKLSPQVLTERLPDKRGRHQGFCFKKTKSGRFLPYICWKGESEQEEK